MRRAKGRAGTTLVELVIAVGVSSLAFIALFVLTTAATGQHLRGMRTLTAQMNASLAFKALERELSAATYVVSPAVFGMEGQSLEACSNAAPSGDGGPPAAIDASRPMRFFAFCGSGGVLYFHALPGCPAAYSCGSGAAASFGEAPDRAVTASFKRPSSRRAIVESSLTARSSELVSSRTSSFAYAAAAGNNQ